MIACIVKVFEKSVIVFFKIIYDITLVYILQYYEFDKNLNEFYSCQVNIHFKHESIIQDQYDKLSGFI